MKQRRQKEHSKQGDKQNKFIYYIRTDIDTLKIVMCVCVRMCVCVYITNTTTTTESVLFILKSYFEMFVFSYDSKQSVFPS